MTIALGSAQGRPARRLRRAFLSATLVAASSALAVVSHAPSAAAAVTGAGTNVVSLVPARLLDTRAGEKTTDGLFQGTGKVGAGGVVELQVTGRGKVPAGHVGAVLLNVTVTEPVSAGYATVYPTGTTPPLASNLNYVAGQTVPNLVVAKVGAGGKVSIFTQSGAHLVADVTGYVVDEPGFTPVVPARLLDTRADGATIDGQQQRGGAVDAGGVVTLSVLGRGQVPAIGVSAVVLNVTVTEPVGPGFVTVWPTGSARPNASNLNMTDGQTVPNLVIAKLGSDGTVSIFTTARTHLIADVTAWIADVPGVSSLVPARLLDTRPGETTIDGESQATGAVPAGGSIELQVTGRGNVPLLGAATVLLNVTVTDPTAAGFVTVWPTGEERPLASNLNYVTGQTAPNLVMAKIGAGGKVSLFTQSTAHLIADVVGYVDAPIVPNWIFEPADWVVTAAPALAGFSSNGLYTVSGDGRYGVFWLTQPSGAPGNYNLRIVVADRATKLSRTTSQQTTLVGSQSPENLIVGNDGRVALQTTAGGTWSLWNPLTDTSVDVATCQLPSMGYFVALPTDAVHDVYCRLSDATLINNVETASPNGRFLATSTGTAVRLLDAVTGVSQPVSDAYAGFDGTTPTLSDWGDLASWNLGVPDLVTVQQLDGGTATFGATAPDTFQNVDLTGNGGAVVIVHADGTIGVDDLATSSPLVVPPSITCGVRAGGAILWAALGSCPPV